MIAEIASGWKTIKAKAENKNYDPTNIRLEFFMGVQKSPYPIVEVSESHIKNAGVGVIASQWYPYCPAGVIFPFCGQIHTGTDVPKRDCVKLNHRSHILLDLDHPAEEKKHFPANYVNRPISHQLTGDAYLAKVNLELFNTQNLRASNCSMKSRYVEVVNKVPSDHELLVPYGFLYQMAEHHPHSTDRGDNLPPAGNPGADESGEEEKRSKKRPRPSVE